MLLCHSQGPLNRWGGVRLFLFFPWAFRPGVQLLGYIPPPPAPRGRACDDEEKVNRRISLQITKICEI